MSYFASHCMECVTSFSAEASAKNSSTITTVIALVWVAAQWPGMGKYDGDVILYAPIRTLA